MRSDYLENIIYNINILSIQFQKLIKNLYTKVEVYEVNGSNYDFILFQINFNKELH
jgi:hypothetical protein